ncbi:21221_t:CDS:2, partial [Dentiscutata erythropus]
MIIINNIQAVEYPTLNFKECCWIGTCVLKCADNPTYHPWRSKDVISYHFYNNAKNDSTQICGYQYDPETDQISNTLKFKINFAIISNSTDFQVVSPVAHRWKYKLSPVIFASIHYFDFPNHPLLLNIHKKYPLAKSLNDVHDNFNALVGYVSVSSSNENSAIKSPKINNIECCDIKIIMPKSTKETFLLENNINS